MRKSAALFLAAGLTAVLAGCGVVGAPAGCAAENPAGDAAELVTASGNFGSEPEVSFPTPILSDEIQTKLVTAGEGAQLTTGDVVDIQGVVYDGRTGDAISTTGFGEQLARVVVDEDSSLGLALKCLNVGSRSVTVIPNPEGETQILVADIVRSFPGKADGAPQLLTAGFPSVVTAPDGAPGITIPPNTAPPTELKYQALLRGDGEVVEEGDTVVIQYTGVTWETENVFRSTWVPPAGTPEAANPGMPANVTAGQELFGPGFAEALIGQPVGSQVIVVIPPSAEGNPGGAAAGTTMVIVFDVLGIL